MGSDCSQKYICFSLNANFICRIGYNRFWIVVSQRGLLVLINLKLTDIGYVV